jgi:hypothetical protein
MRHRTHPGQAFRAATLLVTSALLASAPPARAEVIEIAVDGSTRIRDGNGAVMWEGVDVAPAPSAGGPIPVPVFPADLAGKALFTNVDADLSPASWREHLRGAAAGAGISAALLEAVVWQESRWNPRARSPVGAIGLGQLMPATARQLGVDPHDPAANLHGAARYLRAQIDRFQGNIELALAAYNAGPERVARKGAIPAIAETQAYVRAVTARLAQNLKGQN